MKDIYSSDNGYYDALMNGLLTRDIVKEWDALLDGAITSVMPLTAFTTFPSGVGADKLKKLINSNEKVCVGRSQTERMLLTTVQTLDLIRDIKQRMISLVKSYEKIKMPSGLDPYSDILEYFNKYDFGNIKNPSSELEQLCQLYVRSTSEEALLYLFKGFVIKETEEFISYANIVSVMTDQENYAIGKLNVLEQQLLSSLSGIVTAEPTANKEAINYSRVLQIRDIFIDDKSIILLEILPLLK